MGRGDIKTKRGKIKAGSFGKSRPAKVADKTATAKPATAKAAAPKEAAAKPAAEKKTVTKKAK